MKYKQLYAHKKIKTYSAKKIKKVYVCEYSKKRTTESAYGQLKKGFFGDVIHLQLVNKHVYSMTPNEACDLIKALSAALHQYLIDPNAVPIKDVVNHLRFKVKQL